MPVYLKPNEFHVKDESTGNYLDINAVAEQSTAQTVAAVTAEGTTQIDRINTRATEVSASLPKSGEMEDMVAVPFVQATAYPAGKYVIQEVSGVNHLYYLPNGHEANVTWENTTKVGPLNLGDETTSLKSAINESIDRIERNIGAYNYFDNTNVSIIDVTGEGAYRAGYDCGILPAGNYVLSFERESSSPQILITTVKNGTYTQSSSITSPHRFSVDGETDVIVRSNVQTVAGWTLHNVLLLSADSIVVKDEINNIRNVLYQFAEVENELVFEVAYGQTVRKNTLIKAGTRISITGGADTNGGRITFVYADGTYGTSTQIRTGINYRPTKDVVAISIYNWDADTYTYTCVLHGNELSVTNYFNKDTKIDGYITNNGSIESGNYHSDFIPIALGDTIVASAYPGTFGSAQMFFYDANKAYKGRRTGTLREDGLYTFTIPLSTIGSAWSIGDVYYAAFNMTDIGSETAKFYINDVPNLPLEYRQAQPNALDFFNAQQKSYVDEKEENAKTYSDNQLGNIVQRETSVNLFNRNDPLTEVNTLWQNRGKTTQNGYITTHPIPVSVGDVLLYSQNTSDLYSNFAAYVTEDKTFIEKIYTPSQTTEEGYTQITANRDGYISFNCGTGKSTTLMITKNASMPESYEPFKDEYVFTEKVDVSEISGGSLKGKLIAYNGDSICEERLQATSANNGGAYAKIIADTVEGAYENRAISGGILASAPGDGGDTPRRCVVSDVPNMTSDADLICFEGGINDYWRKVPLGDYSESDYTGTLDTTTICGALESIFRQATAKWVGKPIVFVIVHKIKSTVYVANSAGYTFAQAREKMIGICNKYAIPYYDAFAESGLNAYNDIQNTTFLTSNSTGNPDGCHPNEAAYRRYYVPQLIALFESLMPRLEE